jgi:NitT/TauT family transport system substrate-binding protein
MSKKLYIILFLTIALVFSACVSSNAISSNSLKSSPAAPQVSSNPVPEAVSIKIGSLPRNFDIIAYAGLQEGVFQKHQLSVEIVPFRSVVEMDNALLAGGTDGCIQGTYEAINLNKENDTSKLVGHNLMPNMFALVVSPSSGVSNPSQLKGKDIATSTGTITEYALDLMLASQGVSSKDVNIVNVPNIPLRLEMMAQGKLPAALLTPPLSDLAIASGNKLLMDDSKQLLGGPGLIFSNDALKNKSDGIRRFIQSWQETVDLINASPQKYRSLLVKVANVSDTLAGSITIPTFSKLRLPTEEELNSVSNWMIAKKMISQTVPYNKVVDTNYLR